MSMKNVDAAFQGVGGRAGTEVWRIENFAPVSVAKSEHGKFYAGDSYIVLRTSALKSGAFHYDVHFWLGKDTSQDESGAAAIKSVELDAALGGRAVQHRESQGHESDLFLSYFKPCIIPLEGGVKSGFKKVSAEEFEIRLFICKGARLARVTQVKFARQSLNHDDVFILDTEEKIFQFNGANSSIQERGKALEVVQHLKDTNHHGSCAVVVVEDGKLGAESDSGEFWALFGGFAPLGKKASDKGSAMPQRKQAKIFCVIEGKLKEVEGVSVLKRSLLSTQRNYLVDCGSEIYIWNGRDTSLDQRKGATLAAEELIRSEKLPSFTPITQIIEGFETPQFKSLFEEWPTTESSLTEDGRGKVAALLKQQGLNVKGLMKGTPTADNVLPVLLDTNGKLEVWRVDGNSKTVVPADEHGKMFDAHCYIALYTYHGERKEDFLLCNWIGEQSSEGERADTFRLTTKMASNLKSRAVQVRVFQGREPAQFLALFPCVIIFKGDKSFELSQDVTYLLQVEGTAGYNSRTVFVEPTGMSLNSSESFILLSGKSRYTWYGSFTTPSQQKLAETVASCLKVTTKPVKEGSEPFGFWNALGGKHTGYPAHREITDITKDPRLFHCIDSKGKLEVKEVFNFSQGDLLTEDIMILDTHSALYVWVGQHASSEEKQKAFDSVKEYRDTVIQDGVLPETPLFLVPEGFEPAFFTGYFTWNAANATVHPDTYAKRLASLQGHKLQTENSDGSGTQRKAAMAALNSVFTPENSAPTSPKTSSGIPHLNVPSSQRASAMAALNSVLSPHMSSYTTAPSSPQTPSPAPSPVSSQRASALAALSSVLGPDTKVSSATDPKSPSVLSPASSKLGNLKPASGAGDLEPATPTPKAKTDSQKSLTGEAKYSYDRLKVSSSEPIKDIDAKKRESYLPEEDFVKILGLEKEKFYGLPKWKQDQRKREVDLF